MLQQNSDNFYSFLKGHGTACISFHYSNCFLDRISHFRKTSKQNDIALKYEKITSDNSRLSYSNRNRQQCCCSSDNCSIILKVKNAVWVQF